MAIRSSLREGLLTGIISLFVILLGLTKMFGALIEDWFGLSSPAVGAWLLLLSIALWGGARAGRHAMEGSQGKVPVAGLVAGLSHGLLVAVLVWVIASLTNAGVDVRKWLAQLTPDAVGLLTAGLSPTGTAALLLAALSVMGLAGAMVNDTARRHTWGESLRGRVSQTRSRVRNTPGVQKFTQYRHSRQILIAVGLLLLLFAPFVLGRYWNYTLGTVGIYVMLGLGLNIVVGLAGLLDLGYVAFFAIGAYTVALLTAPAPHGIQMSFWLALPISIALAAISGLLLGIPVLRMRGDYLAIVTLGFGEIIRILAKSDVLTDFTGGPRGVRDIAGPRFFGLDLNNEFYYMYFIVLGIFLLAFMSNRLQHARVGRAWMAMREDEDVASSMGVYTLKYKLLAFSIGAAFAGFGGAIYASRNQFTGPEDFTLMVSINVLCLVIIGGMGSIPGVIMGALVLKGLPEILRQLDDYRMLAFGALLVFMMIVRPEGLWPSQRRKTELHGNREQASGATSVPAVEQEP